MTENRNARTSPFRPPKYSPINSRNNVSATSRNVDFSVFIGHLSSTHPPSSQPTRHAPRYATARDEAPSPARPSARRTPPLQASPSAGPFRPQTTHPSAWPARHSARRQQPPPEPQAPPAPPDASHCL